MARVSVAKPGKKGIREVVLVFERIYEKPVKSSGAWIEVPVEEEEYALYRDAGPYPRKMYLTRAESEELLGLVAEELELTLSFT